VTTVLSFVEVERDTLQGKSTRGISEKSLKLGRIECAVIEMQFDEMWKLLKHGEKTP